MCVLAAGFILVGLLTASVSPSSSFIDIYPDYETYLLLTSMPTCELANLQPETSKPEPSNPEVADLRHAAYYYNRYHDLAPDDLLSLKRLTETCTALEEAGVKDESCAAAAERVLRNTHYTVRDPSDPGAVSQLDPNLEPEIVLQEVLATRTDDRRIVARLLDVPMKDVELGPNLVEGRGFETWTQKRPEWWGWSGMFNREPFRLASFSRGSESLQAIEGQLCARVDGFWIQYEEERSRARAGFWHFDEIAQAPRLITLTSNSLYVLSLYYQTTRVTEDQATMWILDDGPNILWEHDYSLPSTRGRWWHFIAMGSNSSDVDATIRPLLRLFSTGSVMFDDVQVRQVQLSEAVRLKPGEMHFWVSGIGDCDSE